MINLKRMQRETPAVESRYRILLEASIDPMVIIQPQGAISDMNRAFQDLTGRTRGQLVSTPIYEYFKDSLKAKAVLTKIQEQDRVANLPLQMEKGDGQTADVQLNGAVYRDEDGLDLGCVLVIRDVTDQKKFEQELIEARQNAEHEKQQAEQAMKSKQQFLSNMSHEIRTPLNAIIGFTKVVLKTPLTEKQKEYLTAIKISGDALIVLINDILDLAKVDAGKMTFEQIPFKLSDSISSMLHLFETKLFKKKINLVKEYDHSIPEFIVGDPVRLHQIILNLVGNAIKFTSEGKITVSVKLQEEDAHSICIRFSVEDTGIGIPENELDNIFDNFQQASTGSSHNYGGTGLGLAIVKQLVVSQGGKIEVKSTVGKGSSFSFKLEFKKPKELPDFQIEVPFRSKEPQTTARILIVEDVALNQLLLKTLLKEYGFEFDTAFNGKVAVEKLRTEKFDLILMDLQMPEMNGYEATDFIRNELKLNLPIIALTADVTTTDVEKCRSVGMDDYLSKPIDDKLLLSKIAQLLNDRDNQLEKTVTMPTCGNQKTTDLSYLHEYTQGDKEMIREIITTYLKETPYLLENMSQGVAQRNWNLLSTAAHAMIPSFTIIGLDLKYEQIAKQIKELSGRKEKTGLISHLLRKLTRTCEKAMAELESELKIL